MARSTRNDAQRQSAPMGERVLPIWRSLPCPKPQGAEARFAPDNREIFTY
jgi:hypothetical protein